MNAIAILGWGSLVWDPRGLPLGSQWERGGPVLPIEFSRISDDGRLTLVIDERNGVDVPTRYAISSRLVLELAITDLQTREGTARRDRIGFIDIAGNQESQHALAAHGKACARIREWAASKKFDAVIWTALGPRFRDKIGIPFSPGAALRYVNGLPQPVKEKALEYIRNAPEEATTLFRRQFNGEEQNLRNSRAG